MSKFKQAMAYHKWLKVRENLERTRAQSLYVGPAKCSMCSVVIRPGFNDPCKCYPNIGNEPTKDNKTKTRKKIES